MSVRRISTYVENNAGMAFDHWSSAWIFDIDLWGYCGQGPDEQAALDDLRHQVNTLVGQDIDIAVTERLTATRTGEEMAFVRDRRPCTEDERRVTLAGLAEVREQTISLVRRDASAGSPRGAGGLTPDVASSL